jgi:tagatose 1,6-diphosphate aldolase
VLLSAGVADAAFFSLLTYAYQAKASGYLAGRALWQRAIKQYPDRAGMVTVLQDEGLAYLDRINELTDRLAQPWYQHPCWHGGPQLEDGGEAFMSAYPDLAA